MFIIGKWKHESSEIILWLEVIKLISYLLCNCLENPSIHFLFASNKMFILFDGRFLLCLKLENWKITQYMKINVSKLVAKSFYLLSYHTGAKAVSIFYPWDLTLSQVEGTTIFTPALPEKMSSAAMRLLGPGSLRTSLCHSH